MIRKCFDIEEPNYYGVKVRRNNNINQNNEYDENSYHYVYYKDKESTIFNKLFNKYCSNICILIFCNDITNNKQTAKV